MATAPTKIRFIVILIVFTTVLPVFTSCQKNNTSIPSETTNNAASTNTPINTPQNTLTSATPTSTITYIDDNFIASADTQNTFTLDDLSVYDVKTKKQIKLGMTKQEVDKTLGITNPESDAEFLNYNGLQVFYRDDTVAALQIKLRNINSSRYVTRRMIGSREKSEKIRKVYGQGDEYKEDSYLNISYKLRKNGNILNVQECQTFKSNGEINPENLYTIEFLLRENQLYQIIISDYQYAYSLT